MSNIPSKWQELLVQAGYTDPRDRVTPSLNQLAKAAGVTTATVSKLIIHGEKVKADTMAKIAKALKVDVSDIFGIATGEKREPLALPMGTEKLDSREKAALTEIIRTLVSAKENQDAVTRELRIVHEPAEEPEKNTDPPEPLAEKIESAGGGGDFYALAARRRLMEPRGKPKK